MSTKIEWTDETWNPVTGCSKVSPGCKNCYAERMAKRLAGRFGYPEKPHSFNVTLRPDRMDEPLHWRKPRMVFVCSMSDLFHPEVPDYYILRVFRIMGRPSTDKHIFQILTKRPERMRDWVNQYVVDEWSRPDPFKNIWLGVTAENQEAADQRIPVLLSTPAAVRFVSVEPILGPIHFRMPNFSDSGYGPGWLKAGNAAGGPSLDWVIAGGETGPSARAPNPEWVRDQRDQCVVAGVPFFFKGWGGPSHKGWVIDHEVYSGNVLDGETWEQFPETYEEIDPAEELTSGIGKS